MIRARESAPAVKSLGVSPDRVREVVMIGLLFAVAAAVFALWRLRIDLERLRARVNLLNEESVAQRRRIEELEHAARMSEVALVGRHLRQTLADFGYAVLPDGALHDISDEPRPSAWDRLVEEPTALPDKPKEPT